MTTESPPAVRQYPVIREFMTPSPRTIAQTSTLAAAQQMMREHHVRHLPVLDGGRIAGLLSERDLLLIESLPGVDPHTLRVEEAMVTDVFTVSADVPIGEAIENMIEGKVGSAVVCDDTRVIGIFTTIDALRALHRMLERP